jgi:hypothetical protein
MELPMPGKLQGSRPMIELWVVLAIWLPVAGWTLALCMYDE